MARARLLVGNANLVELLGLKNEDTDVFRNSLANVNLTVFEADGTTEVGGQVWPVNMPYRAASNGDYSASFPAAVALVKGKNYVVHIEELSAGLELDIDMPVQAQVRKYI